MVPREEEALPVLVPYSESEHAAEQVNHIGPAVAIELQQDLGVALRAEAHALRFEVGAKLAMVIDLAVECDDDASVLGTHRLGSGIAEIHDGEAPVCEPRPPILCDPRASAIRTARNHCIPNLDELGK
jgi:hypothetical protein